MRKDLNICAEGFVGSNPTPRTSFEIFILATLQSNYYLTFIPLPTSARWYLTHLLAEGLKVETVLANLLLILP